MNIVILAGGASSRFWPFSERKHKSEFIVGGNTILEHTIKNLPQSSNIIVVTKENSAAKETLRAFNNVTIVTQMEPKGMYDALVSAKSVLKGDFILMLPHHFWVKDIIEELSGKNAPAVVVRKYRDGDEESKGIAAVSNGSVTEIREKQLYKGATHSVIGVYKLSARIFTDIEKDKEGDEYVFERILNGYAKSGTLSYVEYEKDTPTLKYVHDLLVYKDKIFGTLSNYKRNAESGSNVFIDKSVVMSDDVKIGNNVSIKGNTFIGCCVVIGDNCLVRDSFLEEGSKIGFNTEVARSIIGRNTHVHSGFIGDSVIGENCRVGANFISANRRVDRKTINIILRGKKVDTKRTSFGFVMGDDVHTGINASTMPGTLIGNSCVVGANTQLIGTIESKHLVYSKAVNEIKKLG
jgi:bifunctional UDP-N-acetylglucosamine pyrophosphorylase/glucosamine-1-phosphate N-acetyltransferase